MTRQVGGVLCGVMLWLVWPGAAAASSGVVVDPDSPAGKEYAIPLQQARREAAAGKEAPSGGSGVAAVDQNGQGHVPLFGVGISPRDPAGAESTGGPKSSSRRSSSVSPEDGAAATYASSATATTAGIVLAVVILGTGIGTVIRLRTRNR